MRVRVEEERPRASGLAWSIPLLAALGVFWFRAAGVASIDDFRALDLEALAEIPIWLHAAAGVALAMFLGGLIVGGGRRGALGSVVELTRGAPPFAEQRVTRRRVPAAESSRYLLEHVERFTLKLEKGSRRSWATLMLLPFPIPAARLAAVLTDGQIVELQTFDSPRLRHLAAAVDAFNDFLRELNDDAPRPGAKPRGGETPKPPRPPGAAPRAIYDFANAPGDVLSVARGWAMWRVVVWGAAWIVWTASCLGAGLIGWEAPPLRQGAPAGDALAKGIVGAEERLTAWRGQAVAFYEQFFPPRTELPDFSVVDPLDAIAERMERDEASGGSLGPPAATRVNARDLGEPATSPTLELDLAGDLMHGVRSEIYPWERRFLAMAVEKKDDDDPRGALAAMLSLHQAYERERVSSRPALRIVGSFLKHRDERVAATAAACLGLAADASFLPILEKLREEILAERKGWKSNAPPPRQELLARTMEAIEGIKGREATGISARNEREVEP